MTENLGEMTHRIIGATISLHRETWTGLVGISLRSTQFQCESPQEWHY